jgi:hypothetical protein
VSTSVMATFGLYDLEVKSDSTFSAPDLQTFSKVDDLRTGNVVDFPYITYEPNFWLLDGTFHFMPTDDTLIHLGLMSLTPSDVNGDFTSHPMLTITFEKLHTIDGLVLHFSSTGDYSDSVEIVWYNALDVVLFSDTYTPDSEEFDIDQEVVDFKKITLEFFSTNRSYRYLYFKGIDFGQLIRWSGTDILSAEAVEQLDMLSLTAPWNTCNLNLYSIESDFSIVNPSGYYSRLSQNQPLLLYALKDEKKIFMGRYYLDTWKNVSETEFEFNCVDALSVLSRIPYYGNIWLPAGILSQYLIDEIMTVAAIPYELDQSLYDIPVMGYLPESNCRDALQQICFAIGAYIDCSRSNLVKIYKSIILSGTETNVVEISATEQAEGSTLELKPLLTGVELLSHNYVEGTDALTLFEGPLSAGIYTIHFSEPAHTLAINGATFITQGVNHAIIQVAVEGTVSVTGLAYADNKQSYVLYREGLRTFEIPNILKIQKATLVNNANAANVAARVFSYYSQRYIQEVGLFAPSINLGQLVLSDTVEGAVLRGAVERLELNLSGGFLAQALISGVVL